MNKHFSEALRFIAVGVLAVLTDFVFYYLLSNFGINVNIAKLISFILGATIGFVLNKTWTFKSNGKLNKEIMFFSILYFISLNANVFSNKLILEISQNKLLAFLIATGVSTLINYIGQKFIVFRKGNND